MEETTDEEELVFQEEEENSGKNDGGAVNLTIEDEPPRPQRLPNSILASKPGYGMRLEAPKQVQADTCPVQSPTSGIPTMSEHPSQVCRDNFDDFGDEDSLIEPELQQEQVSFDSFQERREQPFEVANIGQDESGPMHAPRLSLQEVDSSDDLELSPEKVTHDEVKISQIIGDNKHFHLLNENNSPPARRPTPPPEPEQLDSEQFVTPRQSYLPNRAAQVRVIPVHKKFIMQKNKVSQTPTQIDEINLGKPLAKA